MSKKLGGNGRWESSRMMLPEHREQFLAGRGEGAAGQASAALPTKEELELIRTSVLLPMILSIAEKNRQDVGRLPITLKPLYIGATERLMALVGRELAGVRKEMRRRNIKVFEEEQADMVLYYRFVCRGYEDRFGIVREAAKAEISVRIARYIRDIWRPPAP